MQGSAKTAIAAILAADASIPKETAAAVLRLLSGEDERPLGRILRSTEAARLCGVTTKTLRNWCKAGVLVPVKMPGNKLKTGYTEASVRAVLAGDTSRKVGGAA